MINIGHASLSSYKLVVVPADYVMDASSAQAIRDYVNNGGTVLMTAFSAKVDEHGQWFDTPLPGRLSDVFGLKTNAFYDSVSLAFDLEGKSITTRAHRYEVLEPSTAKVLARFNGEEAHTPALTINRFGKGNALYLATVSEASVMKPVLDSLYSLAGVQRGLQTPDGVYARVVDGRTLYVNSTDEEKRIAIHGTRQGEITHRRYEGEVVLGPREADLVQ